MPYLAELSVALASFREYERRDVKKFGWNIASPLLSPPADHEQSGAFPVTPTETF